MNLLINGNRRRPYGAHGSLDVLLTNGGDYIIGGESKSGEVIRIHPDSHTVFKFTKNKNITHTLKANKVVLYVFIDIVA